MDKLYHVVEYSRWRAQYTGETKQRLEHWFSLLFNMSYYQVRKKTARCCQKTVTVTRLGGMTTSNLSNYM